MKTAEAFLYEQDMYGSSQGSVFSESYFENTEIKQAMVEFAKYHVEEALIKASTTFTGGINIDITMAYDLNNIK